MYTVTSAIEYCHQLRRKHLWEGVVKYSQIRLMKWNDDWLIISSTSHFTFYYILSLKSISTEWRQNAMQILELVFHIFFISFYQSLLTHGLAGYSCNSVSNQ